MAVDVIRLGEGDDIEAQAAAYKALRLVGLEKSPISFANTYEEMAIRTVDDIIAELRANIVVGVVMEGAELIGVGGVRREAPGKMNHKGFVYGNYVREDVRGRGVGKMIMKELEKRARDTVPTDLLPPFEELQLRVVEGNESAIKLYESMGFEKFGFTQRAVRHNGIYVGEHYMHKFLIDGEK
jgi:ribosomal protein S18 acetylase RimI-like enzyme